MSKGNYLTGDTPLEWPGKKLTLRYDWQALAALRTQIGPGFEQRIGEILRDVLAHVEPFAEIVAAGLVKHHPDITAETVLALSPPMGPTVVAVTQALGRAFNGDSVAAEVPDEPARPQKAA